jgi:hypothetical protein
VEGRWEGWKIRLLWVIALPLQRRCIGVGWGCMRDRRCIAYGLGSMMRGVVVLVVLVVAVAVVAAVVGILIVDQGHGVVGSRLPVSECLAIEYDGVLLNREAEG